MRQGFTLIEIVIYTALVAMVLGTAVLATNAALQIRTQTRNALILEESLRFAMHDITETIRRADSVTIPASVGASGNTLTLDMSDAIENPTTFTLTSGAISRARAGNPTVAITPAAIEITALTFTRLSGTPAPITISLQARTAGGGSTRFTDSITLSATALPHE